MPRLNIVIDPTRKLLLLFLLYIDTFYEIYMIYITFLLLSSVSIDISIVRSATIGSSNIV